MCATCGWKRFADEIGEMLEDRRYDRANPTLHGIRETVTNNQHATEKQAAAVENIRAAFTWR